MHSLEHKPKEVTPLIPKAEYVGVGYIIFFPSEDAARKAIVNFWSELSPTVKDDIAGGMYDPKDQITEGIRTEFIPVRTERKNEGYQAAVFFSGNGGHLSVKAMEALLKFKYLSL